jgi:energy-coupling factor transporter ATP-binding protein EcfA2
MNRFVLKDLYLGENDGKKESVYRDDFEKFFINIDDIYTKINNKKYFVVLGRKGSGKTYFAQYIKKMSDKEALHFCDVKSYKDFKFQELIQLQSGDITPNEYYEIWRWLILLDLAKLCLLDQGIKDSEAKHKLIGFFDANYNSIDIDSKKVIEITKKEQVRGGFLKSFVDLTDALKAEEGTYLDYIDSLESVVLELLSESSSKYTTIYDELDDRFRNNEYYKNSIISLLKAADHINLKILEKNLHSKVIILLRTDIFAILNDPDLNKIKRINTITISWGDTSTIESELIKMLILKAKKSSILLSALSDKEVFEKLFPDKIHYGHL